jgi:DNA-binding MarR family transcriptional regulator
MPRPRSRPDPDADVRVGTDAAEALAVAEALRGAAGRFVREVRLRAEGMPAGQAAVLGHLARDGQMAITDLADRQQVRHQSMARTVKLLADQSLVELHPDDADRRRVLVRISHRGQQRLGQERGQRSAAIAAAIGALPSEQQDRLKTVPALLDSLTQRMR